MKKHFKIISMVLVVCLLLGFTNFSWHNVAEASYIEIHDPFFVEIPDIETYIALIEDEVFRQEKLEILHRMDVQRQAVQAYNVLMGYFMTTIEGQLKLIYPDNYAGAYIDYCTLVIQLTDISDYGTELYRRLLGNNAPIRFAQVEHSWNQLTEIGVQFIATVADDFGISVVGFGVDTMENTFIVAVEPLVCMGIIRSMNALTDELPITIELREPLERHLLRGGSRLEGNNGDFSLGLTGRRRIPGNAPPPLALITGTYLVLIMLEMVKRLVHWLLVVMEAGT